MSSVMNRYSPYMSPSVLWGGIERMERGPSTLIIEKCIVNFPRRTRVVERTFRAKGMYKAIET